MQWFRFWNDVLDDPKCHEMSDSTFKTMVQLMCYASELNLDGHINLPIADVAWRLRARPNNLEANLKHLQRLKIISRDNGYIQFINWDKRQFKSDDVSDRVKRYRKRYSNVTKSKSETLHETLDVTAPDTEQNRTDTESKEEPSAALSSHYKDILDDLSTKEIDRHCKTLGKHFDSQNFNQWVQKAVNKGYRVEAIILSLKGLWENKDTTKQPWPYLNHILTVEHQNINEREHIQQHKEMKDEELGFTGKESVKDMALGVTKKIG